MSHERGGEKMKKALLLLFAIAMLTGIALYSLPGDAAFASPNVTLVYYGFDG